MLIAAEPLETLGQALTIRPLKDDTGSLQIGTAATSFDFQVILGAANTYILADRGDQKLVLNNVSFEFAGNEFSGVATGAASNDKIATKGYVDDNAGGTSLTPATACVWVAKHGNDSNDGLTINTPKLTIAAGITAAAALISGSVEAARVEVIDGGTYDEDLTVSSGIILHAPSAIIVGEMVVTAGASVDVHKHYAETTSTGTVTLTGASGRAFYRANELDTRGTDGTLTGVIGVVNGTSGGILFVDIGVLWVGESSGGIADAVTGFGHIHFNVKDLYLAGDNASGIGPFSNGSNLIGWIDHILEFDNSPSSTVAITSSVAGSIIKLVCAEIVADTVWNITAGDVHIACPKLTGTKTGTPTVELGAPGGSDTQLQYNNSGSFGGMAGVTWDSANSKLMLAGAEISSNTTIAATDVNAKQITVIPETDNSGNVQFGNGVKDIDLLVFLGTGSKVFKCDVSSSQVQLTGGVTLNCTGDATFASSVTASSLSVNTSINTVDLNITGQTKHTGNGHEVFKATDITANTTLNSSHFGGLIRCGGASNLTHTLPAPNAVDAGTFFYVTVVAGGNHSFTTAAGGQVQLAGVAGTSNTVTLSFVDFCWVFNKGGSWLFTEMGQTVVSTS